MAVSSHSPSDITLAISCVLIVTLNSLDALTVPEVMVAVRVMVWSPASGEGKVTFPSFARQDWFDETQLIALFLSVIKSLSHSRK